MKLHLEGGTMIVYASDPDLGEAREEVEIEYEGGVKEVLFNPKYLIEPLSIFSSKEVIMGIRNPLSPVILRPSDEEDYLYIVMPMRE